MRSNLLAALAAVMLFTSPAAAQNLVANPSFEDPTTSTGSANRVWFRFGTGAPGTSTESTINPRTGSRHIALQLIGANQFAGVFQNLNMTVNPGQSVTFTGFARNASGAAFAATQEIRLEWQGSPNPTASRVEDTTLAATYEQVSHTAVAPAGTTGLQVTYAISTFGGGPGTRLVFLDDIIVTINLPGDYNSDGEVNAADYTVWRNNLGGQSLNNRGPGITGPIGTADYTFWKTHYGEPGSGPGELALNAESVPEPCNLAMLAAIGTLGTIASRRRAQ